MDFYMAHLSFRSINQTWPGAPDFTDKKELPSQSRQDAKKEKPFAPSHGNLSESFIFRKKLTG